ncbi:MAG: MBL fold metallo-hydrolase [Gammaproteobacteria bacterium]|nr:MBL fold metallo-hydrolase [Gammaproteobacteria bacterium]MDH3859205.1 MBL fold metallo-hydrolase [Gammaproteobacteria bacterium]
MSISKLKTVFTVALATAVALLSGQVHADGVLELQPVSDNVYAIVGELGNRSPDNLGNNATFGLVVTDDGVVLIDSGGTHAGANRIYALIQSVTDKPVVRVINTGGQDHRWLGNGYFKAQGAQIIASEAAVEDQKTRTQDQLIVLGNLVGEDAVKQTEPVYADTTFAERFEFELGGTVFELHHAGQAHTPGDSYVWLPQHQVMFSGDIVYVERMLGVGSQSNSKSWLEAFETMAAHKPGHLVPGHGHATDLSQATRDTYNYLLYLRESVADFMESGGDMSAIGKVDQAKFSYLLNFEQIAGRNAQQVYSEMEWE